MIKTCVCGRVGEHCPNAQCGSVSKTPLKQRTAFMSRQTGLDIRYYTCRKCGVEYSWLNGTFYDTECYAPKEIRITAMPKNLEQEVKDLNEAIQIIESRGGVVEFPNGIKEPGEEIPGIVEPRAPVSEDIKEELVIKRVDTPAISLEDLFKKKEVNE